MKLKFSWASWKTGLEQAYSKFGPQVERAGSALLLSLIAFGIFLRFLKIGEHSLWLDEIYMLMTVKRAFMDGILQLVDYSAPLYQLILRLVVHSPHPPEALLRFPAALFGCFSIAAAWWFAKNLFGNRLALLVAGIVAVNPALVHYSREARPYSLFVLMTILSMTFFFRLMKDRRRGDAVGYVVFAGLMVYSHFYGFFVLAAQVIYVVLDYFSPSRRDRKSAPFAAAAAACALSLPAAWLASRYLIAGGLGLWGGWLPSLGPINVVQVFGDLVFRQPAWGGLFLIPIIAAIWPGAGIGSPGPSPETLSLWRQRAPAVICVIWIALSIYLPVAARYVYRPILVPRYVLPLVIPLICLLLGFMRSFGRVMTALTAAAIVLISAPDIRADFQPTPGMREIVRWLESNAGPDEKVYTLHFQDVPVVDPGESALDYYGYRHHEPLQLRVDFDHIAAEFEAQNDPFPGGQRSYLLVVFGLRDQVQTFLSTHGRSYQVRPYDRLETLFIIEPINKAK